MPDWFSRLGGDLGRVWEQLSAAQKWLVGGITGALIAGLVGVAISVYFVPSGQLLFTDLTESEIREAVRFLKGNGVRYSVRDSDIYVYEDRDKVLMDYSIAHSDKPLGGRRYLKEFSLSRTNAEFNELRMRALEEELADTIQARSDLVDWARVHITEGKEGLFRSTDKKPTASVKVGVVAKELPPEVVMGIQSVVASAVPSLKPADVVVTDQNSRILAGFVELTEDEQLSTEKQKAEVREREKRLQAVNEILTPWVGEGNFRVSAIVKLNFDRKEIKETFRDSNSPFLVEQESEETNEESKESGGIPGTPSNNPDDKQIQGEASKGQATTNTSESQRRKYEPGTLRETHTEVALGKLEEQWISIVVNQIPSDEGGKRTYQARTEQEMTEMANLLKPAVAHIEDGSHHFVLTQAPFDISVAVRAEETVRTRAIRQNVESAAFLIAALFSIIVFLYFLRKVFTAPTPEREPEPELEEERPMEVLHQLGLRELGLKTIGDVAGLSPEEQKIRMIREQIESYAKGDASKFAGILKNWLAE